jgi:probable HAF family extracellular repeat protein
MKRLLLALFLGIIALLTWGSSHVTADFRVTDLGTLPSGSYGPNSLAWGINAAGQVVGDSGSSNGNQHAFLYSNGAMTDLGTLGGNPYSFAFAINASGQIVGESGPFAGSPANQALLYSNGTMTGLGTLGGSLSSARGHRDHCQRHRPSLSL